MSEIFKRLTSAALMLLGLIAFLLLEDKYISYSIFAVAIVCLIELNLHYTHERNLALCGYNVYVIMSMLTIYYARASSAKLMLLLFVITISADSFAYIFGRIIGGPKLCPAVSPSKTISGAIAGLIGSVSVGYFYIQTANVDISEGSKVIKIFIDGLTKYSPAMKNTIVIFIFLTILSIASILGDLIASKMKRLLGIKDFSNIIPGHGGLLDRLDSIMYVSIIYSLMVFSFIAPPAVSIIILGMNGFFKRIKNTEPRFK